MRSLSRIPKLLNKLEELWNMFPDMRFWQIIQFLNISKDKEGTDPFFWEDDVWMDIIQSTIDKYLVS